MDEALKILIPFLFLLMLVGGLQVLQYLWRRSERRGGRAATARPESAPLPERFRLPPMPAAAAPPGAAEPTPSPRTQLAASAPRRERTPPAAAPAKGGSARRPPPTRATAPTGPGPPVRIRVRRLLREPRGRRVIILAREILGPPGGRTLHPGASQSAAETDLS